MNWLLIGSELARLILTSAVSILVASFLFRRHIAPEFITALEEAQTTITNMAKLSGFKSQEYKDGKKIEKIVAADLLNQAIPELQALKLVVGSDTWEQIEELVQENPDQAMALYQKYGHLIPGAKQTTENFDF